MVAFLLTNNATGEAPELAKISPELAKYLLFSLIDYFFVI